MKELFQSEWLKIKFEELEGYSKSNIADEEFYENFYRYFYKKYSSFDDLPTEFIHNKELVANHVESLLFEKKLEAIKVLSIGSGCGIVEEILSKKINNIEIHIYETSKKNTIWLNKNKKIKFIEDYNNSKHKYDLIYASNIDYIFDDKNYLNFINSIFNTENDDLLITDIIINQISFQNKIKNMIKSFLININVLSRGIFFGYLRNVNEHQKIVSESNFNFSKIGFLKNKRMWIRLNK